MGDPSTVFGPATFATADSSCICDTNTVFGPATFATADSSCICDTNITSSFEQTAVGNVTVTVLGGRPPYLFAYNQSGLPALFPVVQNSTELSLSGLASGLYSFVITDVNLFITTLCVTVSSP